MVVLELLRREKNDSIIYNKELKVGGYYHTLSFFSYISPQKRQIQNIPSSRMENG